MVRDRLAARLVAILLVAYVAGAPPSTAQNLFGQNKIQYSDFHWRVMKTPHVDLHFYPEEEEVARWVAEVVEEAADEFLAEMDLELKRPIPFLLYSNPHAFQQTNVSPYLISESVAGLTELIKGRVLVPHNGSYYMLRWVVRHELVHAFMLEKLAQVLREHKKPRYTYPPLWYIEGLAEFLATSWDSRADMVMRDAVINEQLVPIQHMWRINGTYQMYKQGQSILLYIEREFGRDKVLQYLEDWYKAKTFEQITIEILGVTVEELNDGWVEELKRHYFPQVRDRDSIELAGTRLVEHGRINLKPCPLPPLPAGADASPEVSSATGGAGSDSADADGADSDSADADSTGRRPFDLVYLSSYEDFANIRLAHFVPDGKLGDGPEPELLIKGGTTQTFESLHFFQTALDVNTDREIVLVAKRGERDVLHIYDVERRQLAATLDIPGLIGIQSPGWSPDGEQITFSGVDVSGQRDIYTIHRSGSELERLTSDHFDDLDPDWSPDGRRIVFASDRCAGGEGGAYSLYLYDLERGRLRQLTHGAHGDAAPAWSPDGTLIAFGSDREQQVLDLYVTNLAGEVRPVTRRQTAVMEPEWTIDGTALLCTSFIEAGFSVFLVDLDPASLPPRREPSALLAAGAAARGVDVEPPFMSGWSPDTPDTTYFIDHYRRRFGLDLVSGGVAYDPEFGGNVGGGQVALSDLLGNERLLFYLANDGGAGSFLASFDFGLTYLNLARRLNWGVGAFRITRTYNPQLNLYRRETRLGGMFIARYPLSRFNRIEASLVVRRVTDHLYRSFIEEDTYFISNFFSYVHDSTLWNILGSFNGSRYNITVGLTTDIGEGIGDYASVLLDYRRYHRLAPRMTHAFRALGRFSFGDEGQLYYIGGAHSLRGYPRRSVLAQRLGLINNEIRLPLIERMVLRLPMGLVEMPVLHGAAFFDVVRVWDAVYSPDLLLGDSDIVGSFGLGLYIGGGPFPRLRIDYSRVTNFKEVSTSTDTEFSIGFNY